jgi:hypothetical protein
VAIVVANVRDFGPDGGLDAELFIEFAGEGLLGTFAGLDLASGELPLKGHGLIGAALTDENFAAADDEGSGYVTERRSRRAAF